MNKKQIIFILLLCCFLQILIAQSMPVWVNNADSLYNRTRYLSMVGIGNSREMAELNAKANLASYFELSINVELINTNEFQQVTRNNVSDWIERSNTQNHVRTSSSIDLLVGVEIKETWHDTRRNDFYALAVMEKTASAQIYRDLIINNINFIEILINMNNEVKHSLEGLMRYRFASVAADNNETYGRIIRFLDARPPEGIIGGNFYRLEIQNIMKEIPIGLSIINDRAGRIQGVFARIITSHGFLIGGNNSRYIFRVNISLVPASHEFPDSSMENVRISLDADLIDTNSGLTLLQYNIPDRRGTRNTIAGAENQAYINIEQVINNGVSERNTQIPSFTERFNSFLSSYLAR